MAHPSYSLNELREKFLAFFESKEHLRLSSFSLVPQNDKSVLLINAGMTPMKPWFKGEEEPPRRRVCTCQKCIRTGDIDNVGKTARHGTYFEMLGNFSFGDYFKRDAIHWAWEFLTSPEWAGLEPDRLYPSVFAGNETTPADDEAFDIWEKEIGIAPERIFKFGKEDNFWEHGSGPCGPCSEIYYDRGEKYGCGKPTCTVGCDCDRYMEVWNVVFSQFDNDGQNHYTELKQKNIDTGMGLERLAVVSQNVDSLFDVDTVMHITNKVSEITGAHYGESYERDVSLRIITDHIRSASFMICDGVLPSNEGRGYVLRRLLRRAARHGKLLGVGEPFLWRIVETVVAVNEGEYKDIREKQAYITKVIRTEEENFAKTIDGGMKIFSDMLAEHKAKGETTFSGADAFKLYDTYGFPIDLTIEMAKDEGLSVDEDAFKSLMQEQKERARESRKALGDLGWAGVDLGKEMPATEFVGYEQDTCEAKVLAIVAEGELRDEIAAGAEGIVVLDKTPFYAEMGGQIADHGVIEANGARFAVRDVQKNKGGKYLHTGSLASGGLKVGDTVTAKIDVTRRNAIRRAHSATHLLDAALKQVLGEHVHQAGSLVEPDSLRFDFSHFEAVTAEELRKIEALVNEWILTGYPVVTEELPIEEARKKGAVAMFGEKYGDVVRVVEMGEGESCVSMEFCGGTHLDNTAKAGTFRITSEGSVASGVRRIEATTGVETYNGLNREHEALRAAAAALKTTPNELGGRIEQTLGELKEAKRLIEQYKAKESAGSAGDLLKGAADVGGLRVVTTTVAGGDANSLRQMGDVLRDKDAAVVAVIALAGEKVSLLAVCGKDAVAKGVRAGDIIKEIAPIFGGKGGGKPDSAMGGGSDASKLGDALAAVRPFVEKIVG
ncbi:MAG: alanine--tRNA ligase [Oscillospiraceae bacterium]|nr:alanine--tRNA ligase [Oscillospiraceae bacterium]